MRIAWEQGGSKQEKTFKRARTVAATNLKKLSRAHKDVEETQNVLCLFASHLKGKSDAACSRAACLEIYWHLLDAYLCKDVCKAIEEHGRPVWQSLPLCWLLVVVEKGALLMLILFLALGQRQ